MAHHTSVLNRLTLAFSSCRLLVDLRKMRQGILLIQCNAITAYADILFGSVGDRAVTLRFSDFLPCADRWIRFDRMLFVVGYDGGGQQVYVFK